MTPSDPYSHRRISASFVARDCETRMLTFALTPWRSVTETGADRNQEQEVDCPIVDCPISDYTKLLESYPNNATPYFGRGTAHLMTFDFDNAIADFTKAIE